MTYMGSSTPSTKVRPAHSCGSGSLPSPGSIVEKLDSCVYFLKRSAHQYMTISMPLHDGCQIGSVLTPWPSWLIAAHPSDVRAPPGAVRAFLSSLSKYVRAFDSQEKRAIADVDFIKERFGYREEDIKVRRAFCLDLPTRSYLPLPEKAWLSTVGYPSDCGTLSVKVFKNTVE